MSFLSDNWTWLSIIGLYGAEQIAKKTKCTWDDKAVRFVRGAIGSVTGAATSTYKATTKATTGAYKKMTGTFKAINGDKNGRVT